MTVLELRRSVRRGVVSALVVAMGLRGTIANAEAMAEPAGSELVAQALFEEAVALFEKGEVAPACVKFAESHRVSPGGGTIYNLAICRETEGKSASAYVAYDEALARAVRENQHERESHARARLAALKPKLIYLVARAPSSSWGSGVQLRLDDVVLSRDVWGTPMPIDPGVHSLVVTVGGRTQVHSVRLDEPGRVYSWTVPDDASSANTTRPDRLPTKPRSRGVLPWILLATGGVFLAGAGVSAAFAASEHAASDRACPGGPSSCSADGVRAEDAALRYAWGANVGIGLGVVSSVLGIYFLATEP